MDVMMNMLPSDDRGNRVRFLGGGVSASVLKLQTLLFKARLYSFGITMNMFTSLHPYNIVMMLFGQNFTILDRLNCGVVVILVNLTINRCGGFFVALFNDGLVHNGRSNFFMNSRVMVTRFMPNTWI